ncbi:MAG: ATP-binding protein, partial [Candidatus Competibacterales bacterium]|nr:ATP-binding protein [Candidatus Competibacterales bacterium]
PYLVLLMAVSTLVGLGFIGLRRRYQRAWVRRFLLLAGGGLLALALLHGLLFSGLPEPGGPARLVAALSPLPLVLLVGYFIIRFRFLQLVFGRVFLYAAGVVAALLFHQVFLSDLWAGLSARYRVDFVLVEGLILAALVLAIRPLRNRSAEALRYLLGERADVQRRRARRFVLALAGHSGEPEPEVLDWFVRTAPVALDITDPAVWLCEPDGSLRSGVGATARLEPDQVARLERGLRAADRVAGRLGDAPGEVEDILLAAGAVAAIRFDHPELGGLVLIGASRGELHDERLNILVLVVEQLAITLHSGRLQAARLAAERHALQQDKLAAMGLVAGSIAHEIKNPLSSIRTLVTLMAEEQRADDPHAEDLRQIVGELDRLTRTVNQLLQFARPEDGADGSAALDEVVVGCLRVMRHLAARRGVNLVAEQAPGLPPVRAGAGVLRGILFNLLGNALDAARQRVTVRARREADAVLLEIEDDGPGIPEALRARLFQPFVSDKPGGTGLGLYLVGHQLRELGGRIDCHSGPERGTLFRVWLPPDSDAPEGSDRR